MLTYQALDRVAEQTVESVVCELDALLDRHAGDGKVKHGANLGQLRQLL